MTVRSRSNPLCGLKRPREERQEIKVDVTRLPALQTLHFVSACCLSRSTAGSVAVVPYAVYKACLCNHARSCGCDSKPTSSRVMQDGAQCRTQLKSGQVGCNWQPLCCVSPCTKLCVCLVLFLPHIGTVCELRVIPHNVCQRSGAALTGTLTEPSPNLWRRPAARRGAGSWRDPLLSRCQMGARGDTNQPGCGTQSEPQQHSVCLPSHLRNAARGERFTKRRAFRAGSRLLNRGSSGSTVHVRLGFDAAFTQK